MNFDFCIFFGKYLFTKLLLTQNQLFTYDELVLILTGKEELDFEELKANTVYD